MKILNINKYIVADPKICHGTPIFKGTRGLAISHLSLRHQMKHSFLLDENVDIHLASVLKNRGHSVSVCSKGIAENISEAFENLLDTSATVDFAEKTSVISRTGIEIIA